MTSTTTQLGSEFVKNATNSFLSGIDTGTKMAYQIWWGALISFLSQHTIGVIVALVAIFIIALVRAVMGRWGMFGSVLYNYLYFGLLFFVGLIWGSDVFVSDFFHLACTIILYPICYYVVGQILDKSGLRRRRF